MASTAGELSPGTILEGNGGEWKLGKRLGAGSFGYVYECADIGGVVSGTSTSSRNGASSSSSSSASQLLPVNSPWVIKVAAIARGKTGVSALRISKKKYVGADNSLASSLMFKEYTIYTQQLRSHPHLAKVPYKASYGTDNTFTWLVMQKLHGSLKERMEATGGSVPLTTAALIMMQLIDVLEHIHKTGYIYTDLNAENVMLGGPPPLTGPFKIPLPSNSLSTTSGSVPLSPTGERIYLIDFGLAARTHSFDGQGNPATENGTPLFSSSASEREWNISPRDDFESLGYLLIYMISGIASNSLPWHGAQNLKDVLAMKVKTTADKLLTHVPAAAKPVVRSYFNMLDGYGGPPGSAKAAKAIDYAQFKSLFRPFAPKNGEIVFSPRVGSGNGGAFVGAGGGGAAGKKKGKHTAHVDEEEEEEEEDGSSNSRAKPKAKVTKAKPASAKKKASSGKVPAPPSAKKARRSSATAIAKQSAYATFTEEDDEDQSTTTTTTSSSSAASAAAAPVAAGGMFGAMGRLLGGLFFGSGAAKATSTSPNVAKSHALNDEEEEEEEEEKDVKGKKKTAPPQGRTQASVSKSARKRGRSTTNSTSRSRSRSPNDNGNSSSTSSNNSNRRGSLSTFVIEFQER